MLSSEAKVGQVYLQPSLSWGFSKFGISQLWHIPLCTTSPGPRCFTPVETGGQRKWCKYGAHVAWCAVIKSLVFDPQVSRLLPGEKDSVLGPQLTRHPNPVVLKFEYASEPQGGLDKTQRAGPSCRASEESFQAMLMLLVPKPFPRATRLWG